MQLWSERKRWHIATNFLIALACFAFAFSPFFILQMTYKVPDEIPNGALALSLLLLLCGGLTGFISLVVLHGRCYYTYKNQFLALVHKPTGRVIEAGLTNIRLKNWPFRTAYEAVSYPASFAFSCPLQPMTRNPKVVPLTASVTMELPPHSGRELWFDTYLRNPEAAGKEFRRHAFEALQHGLPQELAERLNPYDESSQTEFRQFVQDTLYRRFEVDVLGHNSIFPAPVLKARFEAQ